MGVSLEEGGGGYGCGDAGAEGGEEGFGLRFGGGGGGGRGVALWLLWLLLLLLLLLGEFGAQGVPALGAVLQVGTCYGVLCAVAEDVHDGFAAGDEEGPVGKAGLADEEGSVRVGAARRGEGWSELVKVAEEKGRNGLPKNKVSMLKRNRLAPWSLSILSPSVAMTCMAARDAFWWRRMPSAT